jgi:beta-lactamase class D
MAKHLPALLIVALLIGCTTEPKTQEPKYFPNTDHCFLLFNVKTGLYEKTINEERCKTRYAAASTFKVPLAVMAFDAKILKDENQVLKWDGKRDAFREVANQDHNARTWMKESIVWFSQRITPGLGRREFQKYLIDFEYGNRDLSAGITQAWLVRPTNDAPALKISAFEQIEFMKKLWTGKLPASERAQKLTREITYLETSPNGFQLNGKTGSNFYNDDRKIHFGWFIAHIQKGDREYSSAANFTDLAPYTGESFGGPRAKSETKKILADMGLW